MINVRKVYRILMMILWLIFAYLLVTFYPVFVPLIRIVLAVLSPFVIAAFISYLLYPMIEKLAKMKVNRALAITFIYTFFFLSTGLIVYKGFPVFMEQLLEFGEQLPKLTSMYEESINVLYENTAFLPEVFHDKLTIIIHNIEAKMEKRLEHLLESITNMLDVVFAIAIVPVLVFYILIDYERIKKYIYQWLPTKYVKKTDKVLQAIDNSLGSYIRGQITISALVTLITFLMYHTLQLKYALLLAFIMGIMNIIPYFGPIIGSIPAVLIAFTTSWKLAVIIIISNLLIQLIENSFLSPYIMGKSVRIHPIAIIFILIVGAELGSVIGMIIAVPLLTMAKAIYEQVLKINSNAIDI